MITIPLDLPDIRVLHTELNDRDEFIITVESTLDGCTCKHCGRLIDTFHQHGEWQLIRHLSILGRPTYIRMRPKRYNCPRCAGKKGKKKVTTTQQLSWQRLKSSYTQAYEEHVLLQMVNTTIEDVRIKEGLGYEAVEGIVERNVSTKVDWDEYDHLNVIGIDEISLKKGHKDYVALITARLGNGRLKVLAVLPDRKKETVKTFLQSIPKRLKETIDSVCVDMWKHYIDAVDEVFGDTVRIVVDRYHVAKNYRDAADKLRKKELKRLKKTCRKISTKNSREVCGLLERTRQIVHSMIIKCLNNYLLMPLTWKRLTINVRN